jgi:hypothetical protein
MQLHIVKIIKIGADTTILDVFEKKESAVAAVKEYLKNKYYPQEIEFCLKLFGGDLESGKFINEEEMVEILEKKLK